MANLETNLHALVGVDPALPPYLGAAPSFAADLHQAPDGGYSLRSNGGEGKWVQSRRAPLQEAARLLGGVTLRRRETLVIVGAGAGALIKLAIAERPSSRVIVIEPNLALIRTLLETFDWSEELGARRLVFFIDLPVRSAVELISAIGFDLATFGHVVIQQGYTLDDAAYRQHFQHFAQAVSKLGVMMQTEFAGHAVYAANSIANSVHYLSAPPLQPFRGIFQGKTAVLCGAGPSLSKQLDTLRESQDGVFIFAVSSALKRVSAAGVRVDATAMVDYSHLSERYFRGIGAAPPLWVSASAHPIVLDAYQGPMLISDREEYLAIFGDAIPARGEIKGEFTNVAHFAYHVLVHLGFPKIILIGMDQAHTNHVTHAPGAPMFDEIAASASRFSSLEGQELIIVSCGVDRQSAGKDVNGVELVTDKQMHESALTFESIFVRDTTTKAINSTEGGRRLRGAEELPLAEALARYAGDKLDTANYYELAKRPSADTNRDLAKGRARLDSQRRWMRSVDSALSDLEKAYARAAKKMAEGKAASVNRESERVERVISENKSLYDYVARTASADNFERLRAQRDVEEEGHPDHIFKAKLAEIEGEYITALRRGIKRWFGMVERGVERIGARLDGRPLLAETPDQGSLVGANDGRPRTIDGYLELSDDADRRTAFLGDSDYSPLAQALVAMRAQAALRRIFVNALPEDLPDFLDLDGVHCVAGSKAADIPRRNDARRLMAWNSVSTLRGIGMATSLATSANPYRILADIGDDVADFVLVVSDECGIVTEEMIGFLIDSGRETHWEQAMYLGEGPQGLIPVLWETNALRQVAQDSTATQVVFLQTGSFWGKSFAHVPTELIQLRRSFSLSSPRGRAITQRVSADLRTSGEALTLANIVTSGEAAWQTWVGDTPLDIELEFTTKRPFEPSWLPKLSRNAEITPALVAKIAEELSSFAQGVNLTVGGFGDSLLHPQALEFLRVLRPCVQALQVRTFAAASEALAEMREIGVDAITLRLGAWGPSEYLEANGVARFEEVVAPAVQFAQEQLQSGRQLPVLVPEVIKTTTSDRTMIAFRDAWWTIATFPLVTAFNDFGGTLEDQSSLVLYPGKRKPCMRTQEQMVIFADGRVPLCWQDFDASDALGSIAATSIREIWQHEKLDALRRSHLAGNWAEVNPACEGCNQWYRFN